MEFTVRATAREETIRPGARTSSFISSKLSLVNTHSPLFAINQKGIRLNPQQYHDHTFRNIFISKLTFRTTLAIYLFPFLTSPFWSWQFLNIKRIKFRSADPVMQTFNWDIPRATLDNPSVGKSLRTPSLHSINNDIIAFKWI